MGFGELPVSAAWRHRDSREGFESVFLATDRSGCQLAGLTCAVEDGQAWSVRYAISLDERWTTRAVEVWSWSSSGARRLRLEADGVGTWRRDGVEIADLRGCLDVDLESSACTNTIPVHRLDPGAGQTVDAPAAYVRAIDLTVGRLEQQYAGVEDVGPLRRFDYRAPAFNFECRLVYDEAGLVLEYPGIATRVL